MPFVHQDRADSGNAGGADMAEPGDDVRRRRHRQHARPAAGGMARKIDQHIHPIGGDLRTVNEYVANEVRSWRDIVRSINIQID
jgi:hypothetical protein